MDNYKFKYWAPLINFDSNLDEIKLSKYIIIRKINDYENQIIAELIKKWTTIKFSNFLIEVLIVKTSPEHEPGMFMKDGRAEIERSMTLLRLLKEQIVGYNLIVQPLSNSEGYGYSATTLKHYSLWISPDSKFSAEKYLIEKKDVSLLKNILRKYTTDKINKLKLAVEYFNKSYIEPYTPRDSLIDLLISLENMYLKGETQELGYKLRIRMALLLASRFPKRKEIFEDIKEAYKKRGNIVHGEKEEKISYDFLFKIREYTRKSLLVLLIKPELRSKIDDIILKGGLKN